MSTDDRNSDVHGTIETFQVRLLGGTDGELATFEYDDSREPCGVTCQYRAKTIYAEGLDYFEALRAIRRQLELEGLIPLCYGASLNVWPSAMSSQMGGGIKAYRMKIGHYALTDDLVDIFEAGEDLVPSSVDAQERFHEEWLATPMK